MPYDPQRHHRRSIRLKGYDYTRPGAYFVTVIVRQRERMLGRVVDGAMVLSAAGQAVFDCWEAIPRHVPFALLDTLVIMPDHLHALIIITEDAPAGAHAPTGRARGTVRRSLPAIIQNVKSVSARKINQLRGTPGIQAWQEDYFERIVRSEAELARVRWYIITNPQRWRDP